MTCGLLLLDKPVGLSSSAATQRVRRLLGGVKAGHVGSLDPLASGMLPICLGEATKLAGEILEGAKLYRFTIALGSATATGDAEGEVTARAAVPQLEPAAVAGVLQHFIGEQEQVPPMYSAIKRDGQPLYKLARAGISVAREPRRIRIEALDLCALGPAELECRVRCSKGAYVRVLAEDLARALGTLGHVVALRREAVEPFDARCMLTLETVELESRNGATPALIAADAAVGHLPAVRLGEEAARRMMLGQSVDAAVDADNAATVRLYGPTGAFLGLGSVCAPGRVSPKRLFRLVGQGPRE